MRNSAIACACLLAVFEGVGIGMQRMFAQPQIVFTLWFSNMADTLGTRVSCSCVLNVFEIPLSSQCFGSCASYCEHCDCVE